MTSVDKYSIIFDDKQDAKNKRIFFRTKCHISYLDSFL